MMRLSDVVGRLTSPTIMISVALILFLLVFFGVFLYAYVLLGKSSIDRFAAMPLEDAQPAMPLAPGAELSFSHDDDKPSVRPAAAQGGEAP